MAFQVLQPVNTNNIVSSGFGDLKELITFCEKNKIELVFLNSPHLELNDKNREAFNGFWTGLSEILMQNNILAVDPTIQFNQFKLEALRINKSDCHPNEKAHRIIADLLYETLKMNLFFLQD